VTNLVSDVGLLITGTGSLTASTLNANSIIADGARQTINGSLTLNSELLLNGSTNFTDLNIGSGQTIGGNGAIRFSNESNPSILNRIFIGEDDMVTGVVTFGTDIELIGGEGSFFRNGSATDTIALLGTVQTRAATDLLIFDVGVTNGGAALAVDSVLGNLVFDVSVSRATLNGTAGSRVEFRSAILDNVIANLDGSITGNGALDAVALNGDFDMSNGAIQTVRNGLTINGDLTIQGTSTFTDLNIGSGQTIGGNGAIRFSTDNNSAILNRIFIGENDGQSGLVTFGPGLELIGGELAIFNNGSANDRVALLGRLEANAPGQTILIATDIANDGAALGISGSVGTIVFDGAVSDIHLTGTDTDRVELRTSAVTNLVSDVGLLITGAGSLTASTLNANSIIADRARQTINGGLTLNSELLLNGSTNFTRLFIGSGQTIGGSGAIRFSNENNALTLNNVVIGENDGIAGVVTLDGIDLRLGEGQFLAASSTDRLVIDSTVTIAETGRLFLDVDTELTDEALLSISIRDTNVFGRIGGEQDLVLNGDLLLSFASDVDYRAGDRFAIINGPELSGDFDTFDPDEIDGRAIVFEPQFNLDLYSAVLQ